jgi:hypothetical protein
MSSADRDGHRGALGPTAGVRAADPQMKFESDHKSKTVFAVWCPTAVNEVVKDFAMKIPEGTTPHVVNLETEKPEGNQTVPAATDDPVKLQITERPIFVVCETTE